MYIYVYIYSEKKLANTDEWSRIISTTEPSHT